MLNDQFNQLNWSQTNVSVFLFKSLISYIQHTAVQRNKNLSKNKFNQIELIVNNEIFWTSSLTTFVIKIMLLQLSIVWYCIHLPYYTRVLAASHNIVLFILLFSFNDTKFMNIKHALSIIKWIWISFQIFEIFRRFTFFLLMIWTRKKKKTYCSLRWLTRKIFRIESKWAWR